MGEKLKIEGRGRGRKEKGSTGVLFCDFSFKGVTMLMQDMIYFNSYELS